MDEHLTCPLCLGVVTCARIASCGHFYCGGCYYEMIERAGANPKCAVCRSVLCSPPAPGFLLDNLASRETPEYVERLRISRRHVASAEAHGHSLAVCDSIQSCVAHLSSTDLRVRIWALTRLLRVCETSSALQCEDFGALALRELAWCGNSTESHEEMELAWKILSHCAQYCSDGGRLVGARANWAAAHAFLSHRATACSTRLATAFVTALVPSQHDFFQFFLEPKWLEPLAVRAPAALATVALQCGRGIEMLAEKGVIAPMIRKLVGEHRTLAQTALQALLGSCNPACASQVQVLTGSMLTSPLECAAYLAMIAWHNKTTAEIIAACHCGDVRMAVAAARASGDVDAQMALLDFMSALQQEAGLCDQKLVSSTVQWLRNPSTAPALFSVGYSFVGACARKCALCAWAVCAEYSTIQDMFDQDNENTFYLAGDVFSHDLVVGAHAAKLVEIVSGLTIHGYEPLYFVSSLAGTAQGAEVVGGCASVMTQVHRLCKSSDPPVAALAQESMEQVARHCHNHGMK